MATLPLALLAASLSGWSTAAGIAACMMAVAAAVDRQHPAMSLWFGTAVAFSGQALLVAPFFIAVAIRHRAGVRSWLAAPSIWLAAMLLRLIAGWRPEGLELGGGGAPGIWTLAASALPGHAAELTGLALAAAFGTAAAFAARIQAVPLDRPTMIGIAGLSALLTASLLPGMEPADFTLAAILTLAGAAVRPRRSTLLTAGLVQAGFFLTLGTAPAPGALALAIGSLCMIAAIWIAAQPLIAPHANDNRDGSHRIPLPHGLRGTLRFDMRGAPVAGPRGSRAYVREQDA